MLDYPIIDIHTHLRSDIKGHTKIAKESGIDIVLYMANCDPPLDNLDTIKKSLKEERNCKAIPVSAITKNLEGKELVGVDIIRPFVAGFSDDGKYLKDLNLLKEVLEKDVLVLAHCSPSLEEGIKDPDSETEFIKKYLNVFKEVGGKLHIQHISKRGSVDLIRSAKREGVDITCETCPYYFTYTDKTLDVKVNPPLAEEEDRLAVEEGLADGTIDVIASDYAPEPRITGIAGFRVFIPLSFGLVLRRVLSEEQLKEKLCTNPKKIIEKGGYRFNL